MRPGDLVDDAVDQPVLDALEAWVHVWAPVVAAQVPSDAAAELAALDPVLRLDSPEALAVALQGARDRLLAAVAEDVSR